MKKLVFVFALISVFIFFISCQKEKVEIPSYLIGEWRNIDGNESIKLLIQSNGTITYNKSAERGVKFRVSKIESKFYELYEFHDFYSNSVIYNKNKRFYFRYYVNEDIIKIRDHLKTNDKTIYVESEIQLKRK